MHKNSLNNMRSTTQVMRHYMTTIIIKIIYKLSRNLISKKNLVLLVLPHEISLCGNSGRLPS
jgi:hypothetical protein